MPWTVFRVVLIASLVFGVPISAGVERTVAASSLKKCPADQTKYYDNCFGTYRWDTGDVYVGEWRDNKKHGHGTFNASDGSIYVGEFKDDLFSGQGTFTHGEGQRKGEVYVGEFKDHKFNGQGTYTFANGDKYVGEFKDDKQNGQFTVSYANGEKYVGEFRDGKINGQGTYTYKDGQVDAGEFKDGKLNGQGTLISPDGTKYVGEFRDDKRNGQFTVTYANGDKYVGEFKENVFNGQGTYIYGEGPHKGDTYFGELKDDRFNGQGTYTFANGAKHVGEFKDDKANGNGTYTWAIGDQYVGEFTDYKLNGQFTVTYVNGDIFYGMYQADKREGQGTYVWKNGSKYVGEWKDYIPTGNGIHTIADGFVLEGAEYKTSATYTADGFMSEPDVLTHSGGSVQQQQQQQPPTAQNDNLRKVAIVIGNGAYENAQPLPNPRNDASAMSQMLTGLGFKVIVAVDANKSQMEASIREFLKEVRNADVSLFFYAGHGMEVAGENFMLPTDTKLEDEAALNFEVINSRVVTNAMGGDKKVGIILLDACRNNPFTRSLKRSMIASRAATVSDGLAAISTEGGGLVIAYATAPGTTASDGDGRNSPFTTALLKWMPEKGLEIEQMLKKVKVEVSSITDNNQRPWTNSDLTMEVYIAGK